MNINTQKVSLVADTFTSLVDCILHVEYPNGMLPPQEVLAKRFNVSRTVLREAIAMMLTRNMLTVRPKIGTKINPQDQWLVLVSQEVMDAAKEAKELLEMLMHIYHHHITDSDLYRAQAAIDTLTKATKAKV